MENNFTQIRLEAVQDDKIAQEIKHDLRKVKVTYLRKNNYHNKFNNYNLNNYATAFLKFKKIKEENKKNYFKKNKRQMRNRDANFLRGIITLSNSINKKIEKNEISYEELNDAFKKSFNAAMEKIKNKTGENIKIISYVLHWDETTPHLHFIISNRTEDANSIFFKIKNKDFLGELQDASAAGFKNYGFTRGIKKDEKPGKGKHLNIIQMHKQEIANLQKQKKELIKQNRELLANGENKNNEIIQENNRLKKEIQTQINTLKSYKNDIRLAKLDVKKIGFQQDDLEKQMQKMMVEKEALDETLKNYKTKIEKEMEKIEVETIIEKFEKEKRMDIVDYKAKLKEEMQELMNPETPEEREARLNKSISNLKIEGGLLSM